MVKDSTLQIFLTIYHGQLLATFAYDYVVRNVVRLFFDRIDWTLLSNIALGLFFIIAIVWAILSVWGKVRRNLIICAVVLVVLFVLRLVMGVFDIREKKRSYDNRSYWIEFVVFVTQIVVHLFGVVATWLLSNKAL